MTRVAHVSDPHFGSADPRIAEALLDELRAYAPTLIAISGELTQRARASQFAAARAYLERLPAPYLVVPGNHDLPLYDVFARFTHPLRAYHRYVTTESMPRFTTNEVCVVGLDTADPHAFKAGKVRPAQLAAACDVFARSPRPWKLLVAHHPFVAPAASAGDLADGAGPALGRLIGAGVDLILTGHLHVAYADEAAAFRDRGHSVIAVHAGTCFSTRTRGQPNGYNQIEVAGNTATITHRVWDERRFVDGHRKSYRREKAVHSPAVGYLQLPWMSSTRSATRR